MKTYIKQCKFCINPLECSYRKEIKKEFSNKFKGLVTKITCDKYSKLIPLNTKVSTEVFSAEKSDDYYGKIEWISEGIHQGYVWGIKDKLWYIIKLNIPVNVIRIINGVTTIVKLEYAKKPLNKIIYKPKVKVRN